MTTENKNRRLYLIRIEWNREGNASGCNSRLKETAEEAEELVRNYFLYAKLEYKAKFINDYNVSRGTYESVCEYACLQGRQSFNNLSELVCCRI